MNQNKTVLKLIREFLFGKKLHAVIVINANETRMYLTGEVLLSAADARWRRNEMRDNVSPMYVDTARLHMDPKLLEKKKGGFQWND